MKRQFVPDKEISLSKENDYLKTGVYADNLTKIIKNTPLNEVFTVGLFGNWGTGKSSIIETCKNQIECENPKVKFITYDAWKYANDSFRRMFLLKVQEELRQEQTDEMKRFYQSENAEAKPKQVLNVKGLSIVIVAFIILVIIISILNIQVEWKAPILSIITLLGLLISVINGVFHNLKISINKPSLFAPEQFENCFKQMMEISLIKENYIIRNLKKIVQYVKRGETTITNLEKIVIVIDNIDRCHSAMAYQLLTDIKTFLSKEQYNIVFVIPVDDEALKKHLFSNSSNNLDQCNKDKEEFLRKFFNVTLRIKPHQTLEMGKFAREVNKKYSLGFKSDTLALAAKEFATNPRRIIQLFNNLSTELSLYPKEFALKNEAIICAVIILREEYNDFYKDAVNNAKLLIGEYSEKDKYYKNIDKKEVKDEYEDTFSFMRMADSYFKSSEIPAMLKILTNTEALFSSIPNDIQEAIRTNDIQKTISFVQEQDELEEDVLQFIQKSISEDSKYGAVLQMVNWLGFISQLQNTISIDQSDYIKFDNEFKKYYDAIIPESTNADLICSYAKHLSSIGLNALKEAIFKYITHDYEKTPSNYKSYAEAVFKYFNDENDSETLTTFADKYFRANLINNGVNYSDAQKKYLFSDAFVKENIAAIIELTEDDQIKELLWLFENKPNISNETYGAFFSHISTTVGEMRNKTKDEILSIIEFSIPFINAITPRKLQKEPEELYNKIFNSRGIANPTYPDSPNRDTQTLFLDECKENEEESKLVIDFICQIYDITANNTDIKPQLEILIEDHRIYINSKLIQLLSSGFPLVPLFSMIILDGNYSSEDTIKLITNCFAQKNKDGKLYLSQEQINEKIGSLLNNIATTNVTALVTKIIDDDNLKTAVANDIIKRDSAFINSLPQYLLTLAVDMFNNESVNDYTNNFTYLRIIAEKGSVSQKSVLVSTLIKHIDNNIHIEDVLSILKIIDLTSKEDKDLVVAHLNLYKKNHTDIETETASMVNTIIAKFSPKKKWAFIKEKDE